ncbi:MAG TPA: SurA N-terminal domain-containing protein [Enterovirga sp.]|nr:SurA N-terminal domain-containing protein [Enterovirga sp.]
MLQGMNRLGQSWVGRVVVAIMFGFLIISFGIWGIGDIFRGNVRTDVATIGKTTITADAYRNAYQTELQRLIQRARRNITPDQARALGIDQRVLGRLVTEAAIDQRARELGLAVSDPLVARTISEDPNFKGANGAFDRTQFNELLRSNGMNEAQYVREQRAVVLRLQLAEAVTGALPVPLAMREAVHRYQTEKRAAEYVTLGPPVLGEIPAPGDAQLQAYYDSKKATYRSPEYRSFAALVVDPAALTKPDSISDDDARRFYEQNKDTRFGTPERRTVEQIVLATREEAEAAFTRIKDGATFEAIATERGLDPKTLELGTFTRSEMIDPAAADAAFALGQGAVSGPVEGRFGPVLLRVTKIEPGNVKPYEQVASEVKRELALERARAQVTEVHDAIEDERAASKPLADIARERGLKLVEIVGVDRSGNGPDGQPVASLPAAQTLLPAVFASDVGADTEAQRTPNSGYVWFEVKNVQPARDRPLNEVKDKVAADWRSDENSRGLAEKARGLTERLDKGEAMSAVAGELGLTVQTASDVTRQGTSGELTQAVVPLVFATPVGRAASSAAADDKRVVFKVTAASVPAYVTTTQQAQAEEDQLRNMLSEDLLSQFVADIQKQLGLEVHPDMMRRAIGGES